MTDEGQQQLDSRALAIAAETRGTVEAMRNLFTAMTARIDANERRQERHEIECHQERKDAAAARERLRAEILGQQDKHHEQNQASVRKLHGRMNLFLATGLVMTLGICGTLVMLVIGMFRSGLDRAVGM